MGSVRPSVVVASSVVVRFEDVVAFFVVAVSVELVVSVVTYWIAYWPRWKGFQTG